MSSDGIQVSQTVPLLLVSDLEQSCAFYESGLGFRRVREWTPEGVLSWVWLEHGTAAFMLQQYCEEDPPPATWGKGFTLYFLCEDAELASRKLREQGIEASAPSETFYGMKQTFVTDPDGYLVCFENPTQ